MTMEFFDYNSAEYQTWLLTLAPEERAFLGEMSLEQLGDLNNAQLERRAVLHQKYLKEQARKIRVKERAIQQKELENDTPLTAKEQMILDAVTYLEDKYDFRTLDDTKEILVKENGVHKPKGEIVIQIEAQKLYKGKLTSHMVNEILDNIRRDTFTPRSEFDKDIHIINMTNGLVNWMTGEFTPPTLKTLNIFQ